MIRRLIGLAAIAQLIACEHGAPFSSPPPANLGPFSALVPRRLTFDPRSNRTPSVAGGMLLFSRSSDAEPSIYNALGREECIGLMSVDGGSLVRSWCPDRFVPRPDTLVDTWFEPSLSPDGRRIAFMWQRGYRINAVGWLDAFLMVTDLDHPADTTGFRHPVLWVRNAQPNDIRGTIATRITWVSNDRLRFLATWEFVPKIKGGGAERVTDTNWIALALLELDLNTSALGLVPGGDSVLAYAPAPDGGLWIVKESDSAAVLHLDPATGALLPVGRFSSAVLDLINVDGAPVGITRDGDAIERLDPVTGVLAEVSDFGGPARRLAAAGQGRFVAEIDQGTVLFGAPPALWLFAVP